ncbi:hypothetical protein SteCoe_13775 [Stentor coeruleus]|uniref:G-protein coupled receptors family 2 profile 2 domain-containing protein n=1 Tax=Stentor coeruleus TaxID=5963 RepID=A0A1R2C7R0_9CILI|nr:hypothetical protein SteCoe_13775 [Stentor coeruleus]
MPISSQEIDTIHLTLLICNSISLLGSLSIILLFLSYKILRSYAFKLVFYMSLADTIRAIGFMLPSNPENFCLAQAFLTSFGSLSGLIWTSIIAICLYCVVIHETSNIQKYHILMIFIGYIIPLFIISLPATTNSYGQDKGWCWIVNDKYVYLWRIGGFYIFMLLVLIINIISYYKIISVIKSEINLLEQSPHELSSKQKLFNRFKWYPLVIVICYLPLLSKRLFEIITNDTIYWLTMLSAITTSTIGLLNAICYGLTDNVKETIIDSFKRHNKSRHGSINNIFVNMSI